MTGLPPAIELSLTNSESASPVSLAIQRIQARWLNGDLPHIRYKRVNGVRKNIPLTIDGGAPALWYGSGRRREVFQEAADGSWALALWRSRDDIGVTVAAKDEETAAALVRHLTKGIRKPVLADPRRIRVKFWYFDGRSSAASRTRKIGVIPWEEIAGNYTATLQEPLAALMKLRPEDVAGKVILMHGPPGTGKTHLLRALGLAWRDWCDVSYIMDPEHVLNQGPYMIQALLDDNGDVPVEVLLGPDGVPLAELPAKQSRWRLVIMEDCGELFSANAKAESGQALSRLLNMADGILGQGCNLLFALTTNEEVGDLHDAVKRPGRALANLHVPELTGAEAAE